MKGLLSFGKKKEKGAEAPPKDGKFLVIYEKKKCIGAGTCAAVAENYWRMLDNGKAELIGSMQNGEQFERFIEDRDFESNKMAAEGCPAQCIHIVNKETGEKII